MYILHLNIDKIIDVTWVQENQWKGWGINWYYAALRESCQIYISEGESIMSISSGSSDIVRETNAHVSNEDFGCKYYRTTRWQIF